MKTILKDQELEDYLAMGKQENLEFLDKLYHLMNQLNADVVDYQGLKAQTIPPLCPNCQSKNIIKNGTQQGQQLYICKNCGRNFRITTGTFVYRLKKKEKMLDYIRCMLEGKTLRACAAEVGISLPTSFAWRHRIISALRTFENNIDFYGIIEFEQLLMKYSEKGRKYKNREEYEEAKKKKQRKVAVMATKDRSGNMLFNLTGFDKVKRAQIEQILNTKISSNSVICSNHNEELKKTKVQEQRKLEIVIGRSKKRGIYSVSTIKKHTKTFVSLINKKFRGVATKYLQSYIMWYVITHKYLRKRLIEDIGRMLNLASSDRRAWFLYRDLRAKPILNLT